MAKTPPVRLVAVGSGKHVYGTRAMVAGDEFEMSREWADILIRLGKARRADENPASVAQATQTEKAEAKAETVAAAAKPSVVDSANEQRELERLRHEAQRLGIAVDGRWGTVRLNYEIAQATGKLA